MRKKVYSYQIIFEPDKQGYTVTVPALPGCISYGKTIEETTRNVKEAIKLHLECLEAHKQSIPTEESAKPCYSALIQVTYVR